MSTVNPDDPGQAPSAHPGVAAEHDEPGAVQWPPPGPDFPGDELGNAPDEGVEVKQDSREDAQLRDEFDAFRRWREFRDAGGAPDIPAFAPGGAPGELLEAEDGIAGKHVEREGDDDASPVRSVQKVRLPDGSYQMVGPEDELPVSGVLLGAVAAP